MAAEAEASREARAKVTKDLVFLLLSHVWLALMKRFSQQISYCYLITGCQHEIQIADFR